jgi:hypothetical protein
MDPSSPRTIPLDAAAVSDAVRHVLSPSFLREALARGLPGYRARILTVEVMALCLLQLVLARLPSLAEVVRDLRLGAVGAVARRRVSLSAFYKRLAVLPHTIFLTLLQHTSRALRPTAVHAAAVRALAPFATQIAAIDDTTLDALARKTAARRARPDDKYGALAGRLGCVVDLVDRTFLACAYDSDPTSNERHRLLTLVSSLGAGALVVLDRGYFAFDMFDALSARFVYVVSRLKQAVQFEVVATLADTPLYRDRIVHLGSPRSTERAVWPVRLVELQLDGVWWRYVTNVWDPRMLRADALWALYGHRWTIEIAFAAVKRALGLATRHACHANGVLSQVWCTLCVYQVLQHLRRTVAVTLNWEEEEVSWELLMRRIGVYVSQARVETLPQWLVANAADLGVRKTGRRVRRPTTLPLAVRYASGREPAPIPWDVIQPRPAKRRPYRFATRPSERFAASILGPTLPTAADAHFALDSS